MANTLTSFLVGIGFDYDTSQAKQVDSSIGSIKKTALQAGAAVAGAFGAKAITADVANRTAELSRFAETFGVSAQNVSAFGMALAREGGSLDGFMSQIEGIAKLRAGLLKGDTDWIPEGALSGLDTTPIMTATNAIDAYKSMLAQWPDLSKQQQLNIAGVIGLDKPSLRLLSRGEDEVMAIVERMSKMRVITPSLEADSIQFQRDWQDLWDNIAGITDRAGAKIIPAVNKITGSINDFFDESRPAINSGTDTFFGEVADNLDSVAVAAVSLTASGLGATLSMMSRHLPIIGGAAGSIGMVAKSLGAVGLALAVSEYVGSKIGEQGQKFDWYNEANESINSFIFGGGVDKDRPVNAEMGNDFNGNFGGFNVPDYQYPTYAPTVVTPEQASQSSSQVISAERERASESRQSLPQQNQQKIRTMQPIQVNLDGRQIKRIVTETMEDQEEQTVKDIRGAMER